MYVHKALVAGMKTLMVRCFLKGPGSSLLLAGTLGLAGLGAAVLNGPAGGATHAGTISSLSNDPSSDSCYNDPDNDGTVKCGSSVSISSLPAAWGTCTPNLYGDGLTVCEGINR